MTAIWRVHDLLARWRTEDPIYKLWPLHGNREACKGVDSACDTLARGGK